MLILEQQTSVRLSLCLSSITRWYCVNKKDGYRQLNVRQLGSLPCLRPWDHRSKCYTWIEREFNACQTPRSMYPSIFNHLWNIAVADPGAGGPHWPDQFLHKRKKSSYNAPNHFLVKILFFWGGGTAPSQDPSLSLIHIWRCRRSTLCRSRWSPYH